MQRIKYSLPLCSVLENLEKKATWGFDIFSYFIRFHKCSENLCQVTWQVEEQAVVEAWMLPTQKIWAFSCDSLKHGFLYFWGKKAQSGDISLKLITSNSFLNLQSSWIWNFFSASFVLQTCMNFIGQGKLF